MLQESPIHAYVPVSDLGRARKFYEQTLGIPPKEEFADGVIYESGGTAFYMYISGGAGTSLASQAFWAVKDIEAEVAELKTRGVVFEEYDMPGMKTVNGIATTPAAKAAWFKDSEGNIMAVVQTLR